MGVRDPLPAPRRSADRCRRLAEAIVGAVTVVLAAGLLGGCGSARDGASGSAATAPRPRPDLDRLPADLADLRAQVELNRRLAVDHVDRRSQEIRAELQAVQAALAAALHHVEQRVEEQAAPASDPGSARGPGVIDLAETQGEVRELARAVARLQGEVDRLDRAGAQVGRGLDARLADAVTRLGLGEREQGMAALRALAAVSAELAAAAHLGLGDLALAAGDAERSAVEYRRAVDLAPRGPDAPQALLRLGEAYRRVKRDRLAREAWTRLVRDFPGTDAAREARRKLEAR